MKYYGWHPILFSFGENFSTQINKNITDLAVSVKPCYSSAIEHKAAALCRQNDQTGAIEQCKNAIRLNPKNLSFAFRFLAAIEGTEKNMTSIKVHNIFNKGAHHFCCL